jgi:hypothetical protein
MITTTMRGKGRRVANRVKIDLLVAEGYTWAGWYCQVCLDAKYAVVFGSYMGVK